MEFTAWSFSRRALVDENQLCDGYLDRKTAVSP